MFCEVHTESENSGFCMAVLSVLTVPVLPQLKDHLGPVATCTHSEEPVIMSETHYSNRQPLIRVCI